MSFVVRPFRGLLVLLLGLSLEGCLPSSDSRMEEEKEPHFLAGRSCINSMDYKGAIEEFEKALEANPHSASAHFQLGWLNEEKEPDPAAAIYHYEQFLKLRPHSDNAEVIQQHIINCKQDLAKTILPLPVAPGMQHEFEQLAEENKGLRDELERWRAYASRLQASTNPPPPPAGPARTAQPSPTTTVPQTAAGQTAAADNHPQTAAAQARAYVVKPGDSPYSIARRTGVKLESLLAANPGLEPRRLRPGQTLSLPSP
jgi:tetratricopeptide (TPR) repeat protein